jgi:hypothetical protein
MELPEVEMVGVGPPEGTLELEESAAFVAPFGLAGKEDSFAAANESVSGLYLRLAAGQ